MSKIIDRIALFCTLIIIGTLFSCSSIFTRSSNIKFTNYKEGDQIEVKGRTPTSKISENTYKVSNTSDSYNVHYTKEKYSFNSKVIKRKKFNYLKIIDILIPAVSDVLLFTAGESFAFKSVTYFTGLFGWAGVIWGPWKIYDKKQSLPVIEALPQRNKDEAFITSIDLKLAIEKGNQSTYNYKSFEDFENRKQISKNDISEEIIEKRYSLKAEGNDILNNYNYLDTSRTTKSYNLSAFKIRVNVNAINQHIIDDNRKFIATSTIELTDNFDQKIFASNQYTSSSLWNKYYDFGPTLSDGTKKELVSDALRFFFLDEKVKKILLEHKEMESLKGIESEKLGIKYDSNFVKSIPDAVKAVVPIITKSGHGSGCVVSSDGYIITNSHVLKDNFDKIEVLLSNSTKHKAKIIVNNLERDIALIKIDTILNYYYNLNQFPEIEIGSEVYSIGATSYENYNVGIAKGIISSVRKFDGQLYIQSDATINKGNSGGALINKNGELVGIITAKMIGDGIEGIGFVIPANEIMKELNLKLK